MRASIKEVGPLERMLYLKTLPAMGSLPPTELAYFAQYAMERYFRSGEVLIPGDRPVESIFLIVSGRVALTIGDAKPRYYVEGEGVGWLGWLARVESDYEARAVEDTLVLEFRREVMAESFEDSNGMVLNGLRQMGIQLLKVRDKLPTTVQHQPRPDPNTYPDDPFDLVQRLLVMLNTPVWKNANLESVVSVARRMQEIRIPAGGEVWQSGSPSNFGLSVVWGVLECERDSDGARCEVPADFGLGFLDAMAGSPRSYHVRAVTDVVGLKVDIENFLDAIVEDMSLAMDLMGWQAQQLLSEYTKRG